MISRRSLLVAAPAILGCDRLFASLPPAEDRRITGIEVVRVKGRREFDAGRDQQPKVGPMSLYHPSADDYRDGPSRDGGYDVTHHYVRILTRNAGEGLYGYVDFDAIPMLRLIRDAVVGRDAAATELIHDAMIRSHRHSHGAFYMKAVSAIDNALWDWKGRALGVPVYQLIGGATRDRVPVYGSCLGYSIDPDAAAERSAALLRDGFDTQKWFVAYGPSDGRGGMKKNVGLCRSLRDSLGDDGTFMIDASNGWDLDYATRWCRRVEEFDVGWVEEPFATSDLATYRKLRSRTGVPLATGEHFVNRFDAQKFLEADAIEVVQADPEWCGGVTELLRIIDSASACGVKVYPHGHNVHAQWHVVAARSPAVCPRVEYLFQWVPEKLLFQSGVPFPTGGHLPLPERAGFGIEFDESVIEERDVWTI